MDFLEFKEPESSNGDQIRTKQTSGLFKEIISMIIPAEEKPDIPVIQQPSSIGLFLDIEVDPHDAAFLEEKKNKILQLKTRYETPFTKEEDDSARNRFQYLELDKPARKTDPPDSNWIACPTCGGLNRKGNEYCEACQMELVTFRQLDFEEKKVKVVLKFEKTKRYKFCPVCGGSNPLNAQYCSDCMSILK